MIKFGFQGRREDKVLGKVLEKREEKKMAFGIEIQSWVLGRRVENREREDSELGLWVSGLFSTILEKILGFLLLFFII